MWPGWLYFSISFQPVVVSPTYTPFAEERSMGPERIERDCHTSMADIPRCSEYPKGIPERLWSGEIRCKEFEMKRLGPF
jgi:hypothetical protein